MRRLFLTLVVLALGVAGVAAQGTITPGRYQIEIVATGKVLDLRAEDKKSVQQWANGGGRNQQWDIEDAGDGHFHIRSVESGKVLDMAEGRARDGAALIVADRRDNDNQKWRITDHGGGQYLIVSKSGKSVESPAGKREDGARLQVWGPHGLENQRFRLTRLGDPEARVRPRDPNRPPATVNANNSGFVGKGRYQIQNVASGHFLDLRREDNQTLQQWSGSGAKNQMWDTEDAGNGYFYLRNVENGRYLEVSGSRDGSAVYLRDPTGRDSQKWRIVDTGGGEAIIVSRNGKVLDLPNSERREGAAFQIWGEHRRDNQRFRFNQIDTNEYFSGGRTRETRSTGPTRDNANIQEPYTPGRMTWRGRVDTEILLEVRGSSVTEKNVTGRSFNNGRFKFTAPMPARELDLRIQNKKVRGSVEIVERPSIANNFTAVIRVSDPQKDAADYEFELIW
ncbi:MAG: RICIN domain-containing protein [Blastocatellia bacterium]